LNTKSGLYAGGRSSIAGRKVAVIGGGLCGLTAAYRLQQAGFVPFVLDRNDYAGGRTRSNTDDGFVRDEGACIFPSSYKDAIALALELGLQSKMKPVRSLSTVQTGEGSYSFDMDRPLMSILRIPGLGLIDILSLLRILPPLLRHWKVLRFDDLSGAVAADTESAKAFCQSRITAKAYDLLINPLLRSIFAVNGDQISAATMLWILKSFSQARMQAFEGGMQTLARTVSQQLDIRTGHCVNKVEKTANDVIISAEVDGRPTTIEADYCVIATDGKDLQALFGHGLTARQNQFLSDLIYMPLKMITFQTSRRPETDALIVQVLEKCDPEVCIILINHNMHGDRAPEGKGTISFLGTFDWQLRMADKSTAESIDDARQRISRYVPVLKTGEQAAFLAWWPRGVIIGPVGFVRELAGFVEDMKNDARVFYAGEYLSQSSINTAVATGNLAAQRLIASTRSP
jgi:oxygen-dependent protoporphyrinogen oxidase